MSSNDSQETFQSFSSGLYDLVGEAVGEDLARKRWDVHTGRLAFENVPEGLKVGVAASNDGVAKLKGRDVRLQHPEKRK